MVSAERRETGSVASLSLMIVNASPCNAALYAFALASHHTIPAPNDEAACMPQGNCVLLFVLQTYKSRREEGTKVVGLRDEVHVVFLIQVRLWYQLVRQLMYCNR